MTTIMINIADLESDIPGKSWREKNSEIKHSYPIGSLVELDTGARLFIVGQNRDCDQTPLYSLSHDKNDIIQHSKGFGNLSWTIGHAEEDLTLIK